MFGFAAVAGPLLGGVIVDNLSWQWIFYVNLPIGAIALVVISLTLPDVKARSRPTIDYLGAGLLAAGLSAIVLVASLGGTTWPWGSAQTVLVAVLGAVLLGLFVLVERRAKEPVLPLSLLRDEVFRVASLLSLIVGFALFGTITFLPLFFQTVFHASPTSAGLRLIPLMGGLVLASVTSGRRIATTGHYRRFPIAGTAVLTVGLWLLSRINLGTSALAIDGALVVRRARARHDDAGARAGGAERGPLRGAGLSDLGRHARARHRRLVRGGGVRDDLHDPPALTAGGGAPRPARPAGRRRRAPDRRTGPAASGRRARRLRERVRERASPGVPGRGRDRRRGVPPEPAPARAAAEDDRRDEQGARGLAGGAQGRRARWPRSIAS